MPLGVFSLQEPLGCELFHALVDLILHMRPHDAFWRMARPDTIMLL